MPGPLDVLIEAPKIALKAATIRMLFPTFFIFPSVIFIGMFGGPPVAAPFFKSGPECPAKRSAAQGTDAVKSK